MSFCQFEGAPCFQHPDYVFYKAFKYKSDNCNRILNSGEFFFLKILKEMPVCIGEIELLWKDVAANQFLASLKLYFLPEHTPEGRQGNTGEDEVIALGERLVVRLDDLIPRIQHDIKWTYGSSTYRARGDRCSERNGDLVDGCERGTHDGGGNTTGCEDVKNGEVVTGENGKKWNIGLDALKMANVDAVREKTCSGAANLVVLSYPKYCRYRAMQMRLEGCENEWIHLAVVVALGGFTGKSLGCRVMFCRETFYHAVYDDLDIKMDHMLPVLKGRAKTKKSKQTAQKDSQQDSDSMEEILANVTPLVPTSTRPRRSTESSEINEEKVSTEEQAFLIGLHKFMHDAKMPIGRIPSLGFKQIDLYYFYKEAEKLGGYDSITHKRMWKHLYDKLGGNSSNTSAATCTRKHYERLLLPYERHLRKLKVGKTKKKHQKQHERKSSIKCEVEDDSKPVIVKEDVELKPKNEMKEEEVVEPENKPENKENLNEDSQNIHHEPTDPKETSIPATTEHSKPDLQDECEILEIPIVRHDNIVRHDDSAFPPTDKKTLDNGKNFQHFPVALKEPKHQQEVSKSSVDLTAVPGGVLISGENPAMPYTDVMYGGGYLVPSLPHMLHAPWSVMAPVILPSSSSTSSTPTKTHGVSSHPGTCVKDSLQVSLPSSSKTNQNAVPCAVPSQDVRTKSSIGKLPPSSQSYRLPSPSGSKALKAAHTSTQHQPSTLHLSDSVQPAHQSSWSPHLSPNDFLGSSSQNLVSLLHPKPPGHRTQPHLPPAPTALYLHPSSTNQFSLLQTPATYPLPTTAHCYPRKRAYPFDNTIIPSTVAFPSPDIVLDRIRHSTGLPRSSATLVNPPSIRQQFEDPRNIFRQTLQSATVSQNSFLVPRKEPVVEKQSSTKSKNSGRKSQQTYSAYNHMSSQELHQPYLRQENAIPPNNTKIVDQVKHTSNLNGLLSAQHTSKSVTTVPFTNSLPSSSKDGRLTSALFGSQFTALPRTAKPSEFLSPQTLFVDPSSAAAAAISLNPHLHPAFMSPFLQPAATTATSALTPQLQMLASAYATPATQLTAYEEMLRQNGYGTFLAASTQRKGSNKN